MLFSILRYSIGNIAIGMLIALVGTILMFLLIKGWYKNAMMSIASYVVGAILFFLLSFQSILICGALTIKSYGEEVEAGINEMVSNLPSDLKMTQQDSQKILNEISAKRPLVSFYLNEADFSGHTPLDIAVSMVNVMKNYMNWYIVRRLLWCLGFVVVGGIVGIKCLSHTKSASVRMGISRTTTHMPRAGGRKSRYSSSRRN